MSVVTKIDTYVVKDEAGNPRTIGWFEYEFQEDYATGGVHANLSPFFRQISDVYARPASGALSHLVPVPNEATFGTPASVGIKLLSGGVEIAAGTPVSGTRARLQVLGF